MKRIFYACFLVLVSLPVFSQTGIPVPEMTQCDALVNNFLKSYDIPGATFTMAKDGKIVYMRAFGYQDVARTIPTQPYTLFRIASCSKPITSIAVMMLLQQNKIHLTDTVFGPKGILGSNPYFASVNITDSRIYNITVRNLLEHSAGWNRDQNCFPNPTSPYPYWFSGCDPIVAPLHIAAQTDGINPVTKNELIKFLLQKGLDFTPGTQYNYSNIGFLILGRVIEQITGEDYDAWVKENIFDPLGICDIHLAKNLLANKQEREGEYTGNGYTTLSCYNTGNYVPWEYGGFDIEAMDSHGGWIATARDMVRLLVAVDGFSTKPDILTPAAIDTMTKASATNPYYAKGWQVNSLDNWWHTGALDGTASEIVRTSGGYTWAIILNKRDIAANTHFWGDLDNLPWNCMAATTTWPTWDLMESPEQNSSAIQVSAAGATSLQLSFTKGSGDKRMVVAHKGSLSDAFPADGTDYAANSSFGNGTNLGNGNYVVYNDAGSSVTVSNLQTDSNYFFRVYEYNKNTVTGNNALYLRCNSAIASGSASAVLPVTLGFFTAKAGSDKSVSLQWQSLTETNTASFEIQRSSDAVHFAAIGTVPAAGTSSLAHTYTASDKAPVTGTNYYRLKVTDNNGSSSYTKVVPVTFSASGYLIYPSPVHNNVTIQLTNAASGKTVLKVMDMAGRVVAQQNLAAGANNINTGSWQAGSYLIKIISGSHTFEQKITKL